MTNRLADSLSPYLLQHKDNPVDWYPWGPAAFAEAKRRDVPVFLSVGYAACHWCHVMAHESFENRETAEVLNAGFVSIKVDREERPDVDDTYMAATTALTGHGGWPMSVWLDHEARPFYAGTYFPPTPRPGMPSFTQLLTAIADAWTERRHELQAGAVRIADALRATKSETPGDDRSWSDITTEASTRLARDFDHARGGFGGAPKFPPSMVLEFLLRHHENTGDPTSLAMVSHTCEAMARGGIYDQLAGGFARYSVDASWVVPHFEKMLYDNALLLGVFTHLARLTSDPLAERVARQTAAFLMASMRTPEGGFISALDADSIPADDPTGHPREGAAYAWTQAQLNQVLGELDGGWASALLGVTETGTFEDGASTLQLPTDPREVQRWARIRRELLLARDLRPQPARDDKVVAAWNGLAISALATAGVVFAVPEWIGAASEATRQILAVHRRDDGLVRVSRHGCAGQAPAVLEDYANMVLALTTLHAATGDPCWLETACELTEEMLVRFDDGQGGLFDSAPDPHGLLPQNSSGSDGAYPSAGASAAAALLHLGGLGYSVGRWTATEVVDRAESLLTSRADLMSQHPRFAGVWLATAEAFVSGPIQLALVGPRADESTVNLRRVAFRSASPGMVIACGLGLTGEAPLLAGRTPVAGRPAGYVCRDSVCRLPVTSPAALAAELAHSGRGDTQHDE